MGKILFLLCSSCTEFWAHPASYTVGADPPEVKWQETEAVHSPPSGAEFKNLWSFISIHRHRDNFTLTYLVIYIQTCIN
jgi:hypothetical protein